MKRLFVLLFIFSFILSCEQNDEFEAVNLKDLASEFDGSYQSTHLELMTTKENEILALSQSEKEANLFDRAFVLQTESKNLMLAEQGSNESILFDNANFIRGDSEWLFLGVNLPSNQELLNSLRQKLNNQRIISYMGYGFSIIKGEWQTEVAVDQTSAFQYLAIHDKIKGSAKLPGGGGGDDTCTSGGPGSTSCSIDEVIGGLVLSHAQPATMLVVRAAL